MSVRLDSHSLEALIHSHGDDVMRICLVYLGKHGLHEDAYQDTFIKVMERWDSCGDPDHPRAWILQIARNVCRDLLRTAWMRRRADFVDLADCLDNPAPGMTDETPDALHTVEDRESGDSLLKSVLALPVRYREVLLMKAWFEMENSEIADWLGITDSSVRSRLKRARDKLKESP